MMYIVYNTCLFMWKVLHNCTMSSSTVQSICIYARAAVDCSYG